MPRTPQSSKYHPLVRQSKNAISFNQTNYNKLIILKVSQTRHPFDFKHFT